MNDLISRQALYSKCVKLEQEALKMVQTANDKIEKLIWNAVLTERSAFKFSVVDAPPSLSNPSTELERQKGTWIDGMYYNDFDESEWEKVKCSVCEKFVIKQIFYHDNKYHYCPYCGADMRDKDE